MLTSVVIQGPTNCCSQVLKNFNYDGEVIWSTWKNEPEENLDFILSRDIKLVLSDMPSWRGQQNINCQTLSTYEGIKACCAPNPYIFKMRGDMRFTDIKGLIEQLENNSAGRFSFLAYQTDHNPIYPMDFFTFGFRQQSLDFWNYYQHDSNFTCPETQLMDNWLKMKNETLYDCIQRFYYFLPLLKKEIQDIYWLKYPAIDRESGKLKSLADWQTVDYIHA